MHHVAIFVLAQTVLGPVRVRLFFRENPGAASLVGGSMAIRAIIGLNMYYIRHSRREGRVRRDKRGMGRVRQLSSVLRSFSAGIRRGATP